MQTRGDPSDAAGNKASETLPDGTATLYAYDGLNRLKLETIRRGTTVMETLDYDKERVTSGPKDPSLMLNADGTRDGVVDTTYAADGATVTSTKTYRWQYEADGRLQSEALAASDTTLNYSDTYSYDLAGNRTKDAHTGKAHGEVAAGTAAYAYAYNGDDQLTASGPDGNNDGVPDPATATAFEYDANGSQTRSASGGSTVSEYAYDVRNKMVSVTVGGQTARYAYDDAGNRVAETTGYGTASAHTRLYLTDGANPTGYAQPVEERATATGAPSLTYLIGDHVYGQADGAGTPTYYLVDGHGSTIALRTVPAAGPTTTFTLAYTAYGDALNFSTVTVGSAHLFGGDSMYDPASGLYLHGDGTRGRDGFRFVEADSENNGSNTDPVSLHAYAYANQNPTLGSDPTGHMSLGELVSTAQGYASYLSQRFPAIRVVTRVVTGVLALANLLVLTFDPEAREQFVFYAASSGDNPTELLLGEFAVFNSGLRQVSSASRNVIRLRFNGGDLAAFTQKANRLRMAAEEGKLFRVTGPTYDRLRADAADLQQAYRDAVKARYTQYLEHLGLPPVDAVRQAQSALDRLQADHRIDLQVGGAVDKLKLLDQRQNGSIGAQLKSEMNRLNLRNGDPIDEIQIIP